MGTATSTGNRPTFDLTDPAAFQDGPPTEFLGWLQEHEPVHWFDEGNGTGFWVLTKYDDVIQISREWQTYSSARGGALLMDQEGGTELMMLNQDPPQHTRLRMLVARAFTQKVIREMEPTIRSAATRIVDAVAEKGECDFVPNLAAELPLVVIAELMGVPYEDRHKVFDWSNRMIGREDPEYGITPEDSQDAAMELYAYAQSLADDRRRRPLDDIVSVLINAELEGEKLSDIEFNVFFLLLAVAGNETTRNLISGGMLTLMQHPEQRRRLLDDMDLLPTAVEEMLRFVSPVMHFRRTATHATEVRGVPIREGERVTVWYGAANRDPDVFPEPHTFDVGRTPNEHLAFGGRGPHFCLGSNLARMEIRVMFEELLARLPDMELVGPVSRLQSNLINGIKHLPVRYTPRG